MNYCCQPYQNNSLDCNQVLDCLNQLMNVLTPPTDVDATAWVNLPLNDKVTYILQNLGNTTIINNGGGGGGGTTTAGLPIEVVNLNTTEFTKSFTAGSFLDSIIIDTTIPADFLVNIGTSPFGAEVEQELLINGSNNPQPFLYSHYFRNQETWYFSGLPSVGKIIFVYKILL